MLSAGSLRLHLCRGLEWIRSPKWRFKQLGALSKAALQQPGRAPLIFTSPTKERERKHSSDCCCSSMLPRCRGLIAFIIPDSCCSKCKTCKGCFFYLLLQQTRAVFAYNQPQISKNYLKLLNVRISAQIQSTNDWQLRVLFGLLWGFFVLWYMRWSLSSFKKKWKYSHIPLSCEIAGSFNL